MRKARNVNQVRLAKDTAMLTSKAWDSACARTTWGRSRSLREEQMKEKQNKERPKDEELLWAERGKSDGWEKMSRGLLSSPFFYLPGRDGFGQNRYKALLHRSITHLSTNFSHVFFYYPAEAGQTSYVRPKNSLHLCIVGSVYYIYFTCHGSYHLVNRQG